MLLALEVAVLPADAPMLWCGCNFAALHTGYVMLEHARALAGHSMRAHDTHEVARDSDNIAPTDAGVRTFAAAVAARSMAPLATVAHTCAEACASALAVDAAASDMAATAALTFGFARGARRGVRCCRLALALVVVTRVSCQLVRMMIECVCSLPSLRATRVLTSIGETSPLLLASATVAAVLCALLLRRAARHAMFVPSPLSQQEVRLQKAHARECLSRL